MSDSSPEPNKTGKTEVNDAAATPSSPISLNYHATPFTPSYMTPKSKSMGPNMPPPTPPTPLGASHGFGDANGGGELGGVGGRLPPSTAYADPNQLGESGNQGGQQRGNRNSSSSTAANNSGVRGGGREKGRRGRGAAARVSSSAVASPFDTSFLANTWGEFLQQIETDDVHMLVGMMPEDVQDAYYTVLAEVLQETTDGAAAAVRGKPRRGGGGNRGKQSRPQQQQQHRPQQDPYVRAAATMFSRLNQNQLAFIQDFMLEQFADDDDDANGGSFRPSSQDQTGEAADAETTNAATATEVALTTEQSNHDDAGVAYVDDDTELNSDEEAWLLEQMMVASGNDPGDRGRKKK